MKIFIGTDGFIKTLKYKIPMRLFWNFLLQKWKSELLFILWCIPAMPFLLMWLISSILALIEVMASTISTKLHKLGEFYIEFFNLYIPEVDGYKRAIKEWNDYKLKRDGKLGK